MIELMVVNLKARLQPMHRFEIEDDFLAYCEAQQLPLDVVGGGTLMDSETHQPIECDIEIGGSDDNLITEQAVEKTVQFFKETFAPKGSSVKVYYQNNDEPKNIDIGNLEGLCLLMNGTDLPDDVYQNHDINFVIECCNQLLEGMGVMYSYCEQEHTLLYFYGSDFEQMKNAILPFVNDYPLCQHCQISQIA